MKMKPLRLAFLFSFFCSLLVFIYFRPFSEGNKKRSTDIHREEGCLKATCLNPRDTIPIQLKTIQTYFLLESLNGDTLTVLDVRPSCGCESAAYKRNMKIYPGHADTLIIHSIIEGHDGAWKKETTIRTDKCIQVIFTGPWYIKE